MALTPSAPSCTGQGHPLLGASLGTEVRVSAGSSPLSRGRWRGPSLRPHPCGLGLLRLPSRAPHRAARAVFLRVLEVGSLRSRCPLTQGLGGDPPPGSLCPHRVLISPSSPKAPLAFVTPHRPRLHAESHWGYRASPRALRGAHSPQPRAPGASHSITTGLLLDLVCGTWSFAH